jgi:glycosyltransferase involved in cell wall biosynthesis
LKKADLVLVVSENLYSRKRIHNRNTYLVPNAVDYDLYQKAMLSSQPAPKDIRDIKRPIIGYSGLISSRLDLGIIAYLAESRPDWSVVLIGTTWEKNCARHLAHLRDRRNVFFLGRKSIEMVPHYIKAFDVGIIPYVINEQSEHISPLKLYDYFAAGKPVVATRFPAAMGYASLLGIADTKESFVNCIENELERKDDPKRLERIQVASGNTWNDRVEQISEIITGHLKRKQLAERI